MKRLYLIIILAVFGISNFAFGQQYPYYYQYILNKYTLSPAYAGLYGIPEAYVSYRQSRLNTNYTPKTLDFNMNAPIAKKVGLGINVLNDKSDIFTNTYATASYTYHLQVAEKHFIDFSLLGGFNQKKIDLSGLSGINDPNVYDPNDPLTKGNRELNQTSLLLGGGLMYRFQKLNIGAWSPGLNGTSMKLQSFKKHFIAYASYDFKLNDSWNLEPIAEVKITENSPLNFDVSAVARYKEKYLAAVTFKRNTILGISLGGEITKNVVFMYSYDMPLPATEDRGVLGNSYGGHEVTLGYRFGRRSGTPAGPAEDDDMTKALKQKARVTQVDSLADLAKQLNDQVKKLADSLNAMRNKKPEAPYSPEIKALEEQIKKMNDRLLKITGAGDDIDNIGKVVYFVTASTTITKYSQGKLDELVDIMKKYPTINVNIEGHTDNVGGEAYNQKLSEQRVAAVKAYLVNKGINSDRLRTKAYGETKPVDTNDTAEGRQKNRRVTMKGE
jgi:type IX secretion system PorP/SprF family membrane protein